VCARVLGGDKAPLVSSPANRVFDVGPKRRGQAKGWVVALNPIGQKEILRSHYISEKAWEALSRGDHRAFVEERITTLTDLERRFMAEKGVMLPKTDRPAPSAMDVDDDVPRSDDTEFDAS